MTLKQDTIEKMINIQFLTGKENLEQYRVIGLQTATKYIQSRKWGNLVLEKSGDLSSFLFKHKIDLFQQWNQLVKDAKETVVPKVLSNLEKLVSNGLLESKMIDQIQFDIITLTVYLEVCNRDLSVKIDFLEELLDIYKMGYIPCYYERNYPNGQFWILGGNDVK